MPAGRIAGKQAARPNKLDERPCAGMGYLTVLYGTLLGLSRDNRYRTGTGVSPRPVRMPVWRSPGPVVLGRGARAGSRCDLPSTLTSLVEG